MSLACQFLSRTGKYKFVDKYAKYNVAGAGAQAPCLTNTILTAARRDHFDSQIIYLSVQ